MLATRVANLIRRAPLHHGSLGHSFLLDLFDIDLHLRQRRMAGHRHDLGGRAAVMRHLLARALAQTMRAIISHVATIA